MAHLFTEPRALALSSTVTAVSGALAYFYDAGTVTPRVTYTTPALTTPHPDPVEASSVGVFPPIWLDATAGPYKYELKTAAGVVLRAAVDHIPVTLSSDEVGRAGNPLSPYEMLSSAAPTDYNKKYGDITRYGAIVDADSTAAITASFAQMQAGGASVFVPSGTFLCGDLPDVDYVGWRVEGEDGVRSIIKFTGTGDGLVITANFGLMRGVGFYNGGTRSNAIVCQNAGGSVFENVFAGGLAVGFASHGVLIDENYGARPKGNNNAIKFNTCFSGRNGGCGFAITTVGLDQNAIEFNSCSANANTSHGLLLKGQANRVVGGIYEGNGGYGIQISESGDSGVSTKSTILYPYLESNTLGGVYGGGKSTANVIKLDGLNALSDYTCAAGSEDWFEIAGNSSGAFMNAGDPAAYFNLRAITSGGTRLGLMPGGTTTNIPFYLSGKGTGGTWVEANNDTDGGLFKIGQQGSGLRNVIHGTSTFAAGTTVAASLGVTLPSAAYKIVISAGANKTFWWTSKTTTGFTLNASSSSSDTVDWMVIL